MYRFIIKMLNTLVRQLILININIIKLSMRLCIYIFLHKIHFHSISDTLYRLSFSLKLYEKRSWEASDSIVEMCKTKGASDADCHNYVMVLQSFGNQLYACGTHAFSPKCSLRQVRFLVHHHYYY